MKNTLNKIIFAFLSLISALYITFSIYHSGTLPLLFGKYVTFYSIIAVIIICIFLFLSFIAIDGNSKCNSAYLLLLKIFVLSTGVFLTGSLTGIDIINDISERENRKLASFPYRLPFHQKFPKEYDNFIDDRIGLRDEAYNLYGKISYYTFDNINIAKSIVGKNNCIFSSGTSYYQKIFPINEKELAEAKRALEEVNNFCNAEGIKLYFMMPPNKEVYYSEFYPEFIKRTDNPEPYKLINEYIQNNVKINFVNAYYDLKKAREYYNIFYKDDVHWNSAGAYAMYSRLAEKIKIDFPNFRSIGENEIHKCVKDKEGYLAAYKQGDLGRIIPGYRFSSSEESDEFCVNNPVKVNLIKEERTHSERSLYQKTNNNKGLRMVIFHDSFIFAMRPFIYEGASEILSFWVNLNAPIVMSPLAYKDAVKSFKPDIIIWEQSEGIFKFIMDGGISYERK